MLSNHLLMGKHTPQGSPRPGASIYTPVTGNHLSKVAPEGFTSLALLLCHTGSKNPSGRRHSSKGMQVCPPEIRPICLFFFQYQGLNSGPQACQAFTPHMPEVAGMKSYMDPWQPLQPSLKYLYGNAHLLSQARSCDLAMLSSNQKFRYLFVCLFVVS
jgi:hypothetical protein